MQTNQPLGGRLTFFHAQWRLITQDAWVLRILRQGYKLTFTENPRLSPVPIEMISYKKQQDQNFQDCINQLECKGVIELCPDPTVPGYYNRVFLVPKKDKAKFRVILDLKALNYYIEYQKFKMETAESIRMEIQKGEWATSLDLSDAYYHVPIHPQHRRYFRFVFRGQVFQYCALPQGLTTAPYVFSKIITPLKSHCHKLGIFLHQYLDDWLIRASSYHSCHDQTQFVLQLAQGLGWIVQVSKSELTPSQHFQFLGYQYNLVTGTVSPTKEHWHKLQLVLHEWFPALTRTARQWFELLGTLVSLEKRIYMGLLKVRPIQIYFNQNFNWQVADFESSVPVTPAILKMLRWWTVYQNVMKGIWLQPPPPQLQFFTDASLMGWGAHLDDQFVSGQWTATQARLHINHLELLAVFLALQQFQETVQNKSVMVATDNTTVVAYINKQGGTHSPALNQLTMELYSWLNLHHVVLRARHVPGSLNVIADQLSRRNQILPTEWSLLPRIFQALTRIWPRPHVDLFATRFNTKLPTFVSPIPDPLAYDVDALSMNWTNIYAYAFPPTAILHRVLARIPQFPCRILLIAPNWPTQPWFPRLLELLVDHPRKIPDLPHLLKQPRAPVFHNTPELFDLHAWMLSNNHSEIEGFRKTLPGAFLHPKRTRLLNNMTLSGRDSALGVVQGRLIQSKPLFSK